ncbi:tRNA 2-thiouridine synthesizing protein B [Methylomagnum ishizawai]|uniref:tRNA 2-thiouridine synthesizing protein B n=1 Tax=Methylomagnum ishizawai TaxID=1760988 RepID=A0A1Y6D5Q2_9GAMM|nr:sulfurtransferase complex subunit TusB [Methylomagnum ishizawai]SMF95265.1 tRNA 2-thiouridine synthesizing protein B [Methylomagnum ishizawai]
MAVLHLVGHSPHENRAWADCLLRAGAGDAVLLIEAGVYAAVGNVGTETTRLAAGRVALYALAPDLAARGLATSDLAAGIVPVDYTGFVALTTTHNPIQSWF